MNFVDSIKDSEFDLTFERNDVVFTIDVKSADLMESASLDFGGGLLDRGFKWTFPSATGGCGCGTSFSF